MDERDDDEELIERITEEEECVCSFHCNSGGPGAGAGVESICKFKNEYWYYSINNGLLGPSKSLAGAMDGLGVTDATERIYCAELTAAELAKQVDLYDPSPGHRVEINGEEWEVSQDGKLEHAGDRKDT